MKTIKIMADKMWRRGACMAVEPEDLVDVAVMEVLRARSRFDPARAKWTTFAIYRARGAMLDELRALDHVPRLTRARANKGAIEIKRLESIDNPFSRSQAHLMADGRDPGPVLAAADLDLWTRIREILSERDAWILESYFRRDLTLKAISEELGMSESRISQLVARALGRLRNRLKEARA